MRKRILSVVLSLSFLFLGTNVVDASTIHTVRSGDTLWKIANQYGVSVNDLRNVNNRSGDTIFIGERLNVPSSITAHERRLLAQLVTAEAKGEPYAGQVAVATVILNRVDSSLFPNTIHGVIYQPRQFTPVTTGSINQPATASAEQAVQEALAFRGQGSGSLYFYNPRIATNHWIATRQHTITIGNHVFAK